LVYQEIVTPRSLPADRGASSRKASANRSMLPCAWQLQSMIFTTTQEPCQQALTRFPRKDSRSGEIAAYRPSWTVLGHLDRGPRVASLLQYQLAVMVWE